MTEKEQQPIFDNWLAQYKALIFKMVRAYAFTARDQDDLFQEITIQVWHSIPTFRHGCSITTWIYRIALNTAIKWVKKARKHQSKTLDNIQHLLQESSVPADERLVWLYKEIHQLNAIDRSITLLLLDNFSYKEMATILGISESNVGVKINRIKKQLITKAKKLITMEFDEMRKIWDAQNNEPLYGINEKALHNRILSKKKQAYHIINISELLGIIAHTIAGCFLLGINSYKQNANLFMYGLAAWMFISGAYVLMSRIRRIKANHQFDRSLHSDLNHSISIATYHVRLSRLMRWNLLPIVILTLPGVWESGKSVWWAAGILFFFMLTSYAAGWEHNIYKARKRELEILKNKLENEA